MSVLVKYSLVLIIASFIPCGGQELFRNPGMEDANIEAVYGHAWGYNMERVSQSHNGSFAVKLSGRTATWMGLGQDVTYKQNTPYSVHAYIKQLNNNTKLWQGYSFSASYQWTADNNDKYYTDYARHSFGTVSEGWFKLGGDFVTPSKPWHVAHLYIQGPDPGIEFLVDDISLQEIPTDPQWKVSAQQSIEKIRKTNFALSVSVDDNFDPLHVELEINLRKHEFAFGSVVEDQYMLNPDYKIYQNLFYEFFNWATVGGYKWHYNRPPKYTDYDLSVNVTKELLRQGLHVRGHNMFWGVPQYTPDWIRQLTPDELRKVIHDRIVMMTNITYGL